MLENGLLSSSTEAEYAIFWLNPTKAFVFGHSAGRSSQIEETDEILIEHLPMPRMSVFNTYAEATGAISSLISANIDLRPGYSQPEVHAKLQETLVDRIEWINELFDSLNPLELSGFMYRFAHLKPRS
jgi:hypothetical protein